MNSIAYQVITDRVIQLLEKGTVPWQKPWRGIAAAPRNLMSNRPYRGINAMLLHSMAYESPFWLTFNQVKELGGSVKKGEHACPVVFWKILEPKEGVDSERKIPLLRYYSVFNINQCSGIGKSAPSFDASPTRHPTDEAASVVAQMPQKPEIKHGFREAFYLCIEDRVCMPDLDKFVSAEHYHAVLFHELVHATAHPKRLDRRAHEQTGGFGSPGYSREELIAEMGSTFLCSHCGIIDKVIENSAAYIKFWLGVLQEDNRLLVKTAAAAQKASSFILGEFIVADHNQEMEKEAA